jgi:protocatechuate 3,4-dioxygenase beta subunit
VINDLPAGVFTAVFDHPRLDSLGILPPSAEAEITAGNATRLDLAVPSTAAILLAACREQAETPGAVLSGIVSDRTRGTPIPGATVRVEWQEVERMTPPVRVTNQWFDVLTDENGRYTACTIPIDEIVHIRASLLTYRSDPAEVEFAEAAHRALDLTIDLPAAVAAARSEVSGRAMEYGEQGIQGILTERGSGSRVQDAEITVRSLSGEVVASGVTNERGVFRLATPTPGRYLLSAETLGYGPLEGEAIDVSLGQLTVLEIQMVPEAVALEPLVATAEPRAYHLEVEGFYRRMETGLGKFMTPEVFEERKPRMASDLLFGIPGVNVAEPTRGDGGRAVYFRGILGGGVCWPMVYVNRMLVSTGGTSVFAEPAALDELVDAADVLAMEVYRSPAEIQPEFSGPNSGCGVIVLWTRRGGSD